MWGFFLRVLTAVILTGISAYLSYRKPEAPDPGTLDDLGNPRADEGAELTKVFGTVTIGDPQVAWFGDFQTGQITKEGPRKYGLFGPKQQIPVGFQYFLGVHFVLCLGPVDRLNRIKVDKRAAFVGSSRTGLIQICQPNLFGASDREGGITGLCSVMLGEDDQAANDYLTTYAGLPQPAYRGVTSVVLRRVYIGNSPNLRPWEFRVRRIDSVDPGYNGGTQWLPAISQIYQRDAFPIGSPQAIMFVVDTSLSMDGTRITNAKAALVGVLNDLRTQLGPQRLGSIRIIGWNGDVDDEIQINNASSGDYDTLIAFVNGLTLSLGNELESAFLDAQAFFASQALCKVRTMNLLTDGTEFDGVAEATAIYETFDNVLVAGFSIDTGVSSNLDSVTDIALEVDGGDSQQIQDAIRGAYAEYDMNPAHILREVLLSPDAGGSGIDSAAGSTWEDVAQVLYDEKFGLSIAWRGASDRADFKREVERHIDGRSYIDRRTGKWEIKLIRDDYDSETLPVFDTSNVISWDNVNFPEPNTLLNQLVVVWNDPEKDESTSLTISNPARIRMNGSRVIQERVEYLAINRTDLAGRVAQRDLAARSAPLITGEFLTKYLPTDLNLGSPIVINNPRLQIFNRIVRITEIEDGNIRDNSTRVRFIEDRFALSDENVLEIEAPTTALLFPDPTSPRMVEEAPRYIVLSRLGEPTADEAFTADAETGFLFVAGSRPSSISSNTILSRDAGAGYAEVDSMPFVPGATTLGDLAGRADRVKIVVQSRDNLLAVAIGTQAFIGGEQVVVDLVEEGDASIITDYWFPTETPDATLTVYTVTLQRGCLDTVPRLHPAGSGLVIFGIGGIFEDTIQTDGQSVAVKLQTVTSRGVLSLVSAPEDTVTFASRALRPYPAGDFQLDGEYEAGVFTTTDVVMTWGHRDRTLNSLIPHSNSGPVSPEAGVSYRVIIEAFDNAGASLGNVVDTNVADDLIYTFDSTTPLPDGTAILRFSVVAIRDTLENWQTPSIDKIIFLPPGDLSFEVL
jgi:uncharacterized protein YegL